MNPASVSVIIPARNEEQTIARAVDSLAAQPEVSEIIVVNDQSMDGTAAVLSGLAARISKLKIQETRELPRGWIGKNYAASVGAATAHGEWLLFTDADTMHLAGSVERALADAQTHCAVMVSYSPEQEMHTFWERALIPFIYSRLAEKFSYTRVSDSHFPDAAANGQFLLVRRDVYEAIGGHRAVADEVLEDVALARRLKQAGYAIYFASGQGIARTRMYRSFSAMWEGWTKNLYPLIGGSGSAVARELLVVVPWLPVALILFGAVGTRGVLTRVLLILGFVLLAGRHAAYAGELRRSGYAASLILYYVPAVMLYAAALLVSAWKNTRGSVVWKGREYPAGMR